MPKDPPACSSAPENAPRLPLLLERIQTTLGQHADGLTHPQLREVLGLSTRDVTAALERALSRKLVRRTGARKGLRYVSVSRGDT